MFASLDPSKPVQKVTFVFGTDVNLLSRQQLLDAAVAVKADVERLEKANEGLDSAAIAEQIKEAESALGEIKQLLDADVSAEAAPAKAE